MAGFEPALSRFRTEHFTRLSYTPFRVVIVALYSGIEPELQA